MLLCYLPGDNEQAECMFACAWENQGDLTYAIQVPAC